MEVHQTSPIKQSNSSPKGIKNAVRKEVIVRPSKMFGTNLVCTTLVLSSRAIRGRSEGSGGIQLSGSTRVGRSFAFGTVHQHIPPQIEKLRYTTPLQPWHPFHSSLVYIAPGLMSNSFGVYHDAFSLHRFTVHNPRTPLFHKTKTKVSFGRQGVTEGIPSSSTAFKYRDPAELPPKSVQWNLEWNLKSLAGLGGLTPPKGGCWSRKGCWQFHFTGRFVWSLWDFHGQDLKWAAARHSGAKFKNKPYIFATY